jgi:LAGLIDADG endonuclease
MNFSNKGFSFAIYSIDKKTLLEIKRVLGFGNIYYDALNIKWRYSVESRYEVYLILLMLNGNLVLTHRYFNFISIAQEFNQRFFKGKIFYKQINIVFHAALPDLNDRWLAGFTDAEGHFGLPIELGRVFISHYISITFEIGQNGNRWLFSYLKDLFKGGILFPKLDKNPDQHNRIIFKGTKLGSNPVTLLFSYFDSYPLITKLYIYNEWRSIHNSLLNKEHLDINKLPFLVQRCESLNNKSNYVKK